MLFPSHMMPATIQAQLTQKTPVIAMVQAGKLPHGQGETCQHAVVIIACSETQVWLLDPATSSEPIIVSIDEFTLAWSEMDIQYAVVSVIGKEG
jgi:hypothetical protein